MGSWQEWGLSIIASSAGGAALIAIAGYLGRAQLSHWLSKDLEEQKARHQRDLEAQKAQHQRDLESYKVSLIAETERAKASQDVRKAMAMKIAEKRVSAIDRLHKGLLATELSRVVAAAGFLAVADASNMEWLGATKTSLFDGMGEISNATSDASQVLSIEERSILRTYAVELMAIANKLNVTDPGAALKAYNDNEKVVSKLAFDVGLIVERHLLDMLAMDTLGK